MIINRSIPLIEETNAKESRPLYFVKKGDNDRLRELSGDHWPYLKAQRAEIKQKEFFLLPSNEGISGAIFCYDNEKNPDAYGCLAQKLPEGAWFPHAQDETILEALFLGFCLEAYRFSLSHRSSHDAMDQKKPAGCQLIVPSFFARDKLKNLKSLVQTIWLGRDLINMPANLLGPQELAQKAAKELRKRGAEVDIIQGEALEKNYPCLAAVGAGSDRKAVVLSAKWKARDNAPLIALAGKGVCFDTGGYDLKPSASMLKMKKDMGGAALMLGLACALIDTHQDVAIELRIGCVENSVSGRAMRPGDVLKTRQGLTVEIGNTDAEGRLVLCDLITELGELKPDVIVDAATLTGAARVALGPDLPALFCNNEILANQIIIIGGEIFDPLWRLPLWPGYESWLKSKVADCNNISMRPMAGAITASLYLQKFVPNNQKWVHIDSYAWNDDDRPGHPQGGEMMAMRTLFSLFSGNFTVES
ncbi:leucyl aminopeptidase family protein [Aristophania vespae]|uniref:Leucyl aminopeptidase family protein n=1 Tax=Aristophania vespae TaxID=2697033 RepID=A0A6P1NG13_9PROT|nr:leucyl aminopeptidase family protein [Aristophania vespae]QHI95404.1 leucyl aminopeptidase family protein [Aristophania vespae]